MMFENIVIGDVISVSGTKISIRAGGVPVSEDSLFINPALLKGYDPHLTGALTGYGCPDSSISVEVNSGALTAAAGQLFPGDRVLLFTPDAQIYYLICKVVSYG